MNIDEAIIIVSKYGEVLEKAPPSNYGLPEKFLPYKKEVIKEAIKTYIVKTNIDKKRLEQFKGGYMTLALYIPDKIYEITSKGENALNFAGPNHPYEKFVQPALKIVDKLLKEKHCLLDEINRYIDNNLIE